MEKQISSGLKITFLLHFIVGLFFGLVLLLVPEVMGTIGGQPILEPIAYRIVGAAIIGFAASSWWSYRETLWESVRIVVQVEILWPFLFVVVSVYGILTGQLPPADWVNVLIVGGFGIAFVYFYLNHR
jgi:hypothetical protein